MSAKPVYILNGPNLNLLGKREPHIYGHETLDDVQRRCENRSSLLGLTVDFRQSNHEGVLIDWVHEAREAASAVIVNAGAYSHTSIAIFDALLALTVPCVEVHLSNLYKRDTFRHHSYVSKAALGVICGFGPKGYELALEALAEKISAGPDKPAV